MQCPLFTALSSSLVPNGNSGFPANLCLQGKVQRTVRAQHLTVAPITASCRPQSKTLTAKSPSASTASSRHRGCDWGRQPCTRISNPSEWLLLASGMGYPILSTLETVLVCEVSSWKGHGVMSGLSPVVSCTMLVLSRTKYLCLPRNPLVMEVSDRKWSVVLLT